MNKNEVYNCFETAVSYGDKIILAVRVLIILYYTYWLRVKFEYKMLSIRVQLFNLKQQQCRNPEK